MASSSSTSWHQLAMLRKRGQKPGLPVFITDEPVRLDDTGVLVLGLPQEGEEDLLYGLNVVALLAKNETNIAIAQRIVGAEPAAFTVCWRGADAQRVVQ